MRVDDVNPAPVNPAAGAQPSEKPQGIAQEPASELDDAVELSRLSEALAEAGTDAARIERLRAAVRSGAYQVPASEVAGKIVDFHKE